MPTRFPSTTYVLIAALAISAPSAWAQQQGQGQQAPQAQDQQDQQAQQQGQNAQGQTQTAQQDQQQGGGQGGAAPSAPTVVLTFTVTDIEADDLMDEVVDMAREPNVARITVSPETQGPASGVLVFETLGRFSDWRDERMSDFFAPFGEAASVETVLQVFRADLLRASDPRSAMGSDGMTVEYSNTDNDAAGDADIDAVTVICPGNDAECSPSN